MSEKAKGKRPTIQVNENKIMGNLVKEQQKEKTWTLSVSKGDKKIASTSKNHGNQAIALYEHTIVRRTKKRETFSKKMVMNDHDRNG